LDIARTHLGGAEVVGIETPLVNDIRYGIWTPCFYDSQNDRTCFVPDRGYTISLKKGSNTAVVNAMWTRGLVIHPVATVVTFFAFLFALFSSKSVMGIISSLIAFLAALLTLIAFAIDIALFALIRVESDNLGAGVTTITGPGFWLTFASFILLLVGGCTVCFGCRQSRRLDGASASTGNRTQTRQRKPLWGGLKRNRNK